MSLRPSRRPARRSPGTGRRPRQRRQARPSSGRAGWRCPARPGPGGLGGGDPAGTVQRRPDHLRPHPPVGRPRPRSPGSTAPPTRPRPVTGPGKIRSPSPGWRPIPQTKQSGNTGSLEVPGAARPPCSASASETVPGISSAALCGEGAASAISVRPCGRGPSLRRSRSTAIGVASGGGRRSVTVAGPSTYAAIRPQT